MKAILEQIVADAILHAKWLNTLSFMENAGARKISACEDPLNTDLIQLKHAAEEHRHAYYLKKQIGKLGIEGFEFYNESSLIGGKASVQYLHRLDVKTSRYLKEQFNLTGQELRYAAYLFVTYAIEVRADELYPIYQEVLTSVGSKVMVKSIILEEEGHLEEMISQLKGFDPKWEAHAEHVLQIEAALFHHWIAEVSKEVALCDVNN
ncbi:hypothetical protein SMI01S_34380 [Sphingobacterium mizutaii NBRC 14946 = DSM 11724]|uniref:Ferritin-like domain-containing protein n=2 Tax=Sphingobacterium mizutaii TaxID=1010 RepID=A0AAJ4XCN5_9SPHI|nr:hypothetical protein [Sphingobacterium mizutaii]GEM69832.1 hypothetical protein SMI01S_34380 [Sphingobacterium mizutaii NBRC 14946 = DSM 11724]SDL12692.1 hypothetical protein SAMN05192578_1011418 [Sphingobacterium mizutaii]SNV51814.1 Uncharacterised protein [Sphingobacterium mizutaii]